MPHNYICKGAGCGVLIEWNRDELIVVASVAWCPSISYSVTTGNYHP